MRDRVEKVIHSYLNDSHKIAEVKKNKNDLEFIKSVLKLNPNGSYDIDSEHADISPFIKKDKFYTYFRVPPVLVKNGRFIIKFRNCDIGFDCSRLGLISLEGSPKKVLGSFDCGYNNLTTLKGGPSEVHYGFYCNNNKLTSLEGGPTYVVDQYDCEHNKLITLKGAPYSIEGDFFCSYNKLKNLEGAPYFVGGVFICENNELTSLSGPPLEVDQDFYCRNNKKKFTIDEVLTDRMVWGKVVC